MTLTDVRARWAALDTRWRRTAAIGGAVLGYLVLLRLPGLGPWLRDHAPLGVIVIGIVYGAVVALGAMGLILIYRANRFINFAYGSLGSMIGVTAIGMHLQHDVPYFVALPLAVVAGVATGAVIELAVIRRFQNASRLVLTVASIGLAQLLGGLELLFAKAIGFIALTGGFRAPLDVSFRIDVKVLAGDEILIVAVVPLVIAGLAWFLLRTDAGVAVRASAENVERALLLGIPVRRLSTIVWMIAGGLATLTFMLQAPFAGVKPGVAATGATVLLPPLAAAVVARMEVLPTAFAAGLGLGIMEQVVRWNSSGTPSLVSVAYLVVIVGALLLQRGKLSRAQEGAGSSWSATGIVKPTPPELRGLPEVRIIRAVLVATVVLALVLVPATWSASNQLLAGFAMVWGMIAVSLVVLTGWGGNISLGQFGLAGVAGMVAGNLIDRWNVDFFLVVLAAGAAGALIALLVGLPALRIRGLFLAVTTLAFAVALDSYFLNLDNFPELIPSSIDRPLLWERFDMEDGYTAYLVCLAFLGLSLLAAAGVRKSRSGRVLIATRDNQRGADAAGVPTTAAKLSGFLLAGSIAGVAGALQVLLLHSLSPGSFNPADSITVFSTAVIGGLGSLTGALVGVFLFRYLETITALGDLRLALTGFGLLVVLYLLPGGFGQLLFSLRDRALRRIAERRGILVPSLVADKLVDERADQTEDQVDLLRGALAEPDRSPVGAGR